MAMDHFVEMVEAKLANGPNEVPSWVHGCLFLILMLYIYTQIGITYTYGSLVATLAMVEDPSPTAVVSTVESDAPPPYADNPDAKLPVYEEETVLLLHSKPITSSNHGTVKHMRRMGGRGAIFRGFGIALLYGLLTHWIANFVFWLVGGDKLGAALGFIFSQLALYRLNMLWTHLVISKPSSKPFYKRFVPRSVAKKAALPTLAWASLHVAISWMFVALVDLVGLNEDLAQPLEKWECMWAVSAGMKIVMLLGVALGLTLLLYVPANVALTRCQAALLAEEEEPIIPFDRTYAGRVDPSAKRLRMKDAWSSFDWNARVRLLKVYLRTAMYQVLSTLFFATCAVLTVAGWLIIYWPQ